MSTPTVDELVERVRRGGDWLAEHDPKGIFYLWHVEAGIQPRQADRLPAMSDSAHPWYIEGRAEKFREWVEQYAIWLRLYALLDRAAEGAP